MVNVDSTFILQSSQAMCNDDMRMYKVKIHVWDIRWYMNEGLEVRGDEER